MKIKFFRNFTIFFIKNRYLILHYYINDFGALLETTSVLLIPLISFLRKTM